MKYPDIEGISKEEQEKFYNFLQENYPVYSLPENPYVKFFPDGHYIIAHPLMFHWTVLRGAIGDYARYIDRFCFQNVDLCKEAIEKWNDPKEDCPGKWHRHPKTGRRRVYTGDTYKETIAF